MRSRVNFWIVAGLFVLVPIVLNPVGYNRFELQKVALVCLAVGAGMLWRLARPGQANPMDRPAMWPAIAVAASWVIATLLSVEPVVSALGLGMRGQGVFVGVCYVAIYWWLVRDRVAVADARRLLLAAALGSAVVSAYGIYQHLAYTPVPGRMAFSGRAASTLGNPMLLGGYLVMVMPATLVLALSPFGAPPLGGSESEAAPFRSRPIWLRGGLWLLLIAQLVCLVFTGTRSAWGALLAVACASLIAWGWATHKRAALAAGLALPALFAALVVAVNVRWPVGDRLRELPFVERLSIRAEIEHGGGVERVRPMVWRACLRLWKNGRAGGMEPRRLPAGLRRVVGFGPETTAATFWSVFPESLVRDQGRRVQIARAHNLFLDVLLERGMLGLAAMCWLWGVFVARALRRLRDSAAPAQARALTAACLAGAAAHAMTAQIGLEMTAASVLLYGYFGIVVGMDTRPRGGERQTPGRRWLALRAAAALVVLAGMATMGIRLAADAPFGRAFRLRKEGRLGEALEANARAIRLMPLHGDYPLHEAKLLLAMAGRVPRVKGSAAFRMELLDRALALAERAIHLRPAMPQYYEAAARICAAAMAEGRPALASRCYDYWTKANRVCPGRPQHWEGLADYYRRRKEWDAAITHLQRSLQIEPRHYPTWIDLARVALEKGDRKLAEASIDEALRVKPDGRDALELRARIERRE